LLRRDWGKRKVSRTTQKKTEKNGKGLRKLRKVTESIENRGKRTRGKLKRDQKLT
jgi:hypothetical protein